MKFRVALFGTEVVADSALFGTSKKLVAEPSLFGTYFGGERVPPAPLGWYLHRYCSENQLMFVCKL